MFELDLFFYFEIAAGILGLSATLAIAIALYLKQQVKSSTSDVAGIAALETPPNSDRLEASNPPVAIGPTLNPQVAGTVSVTDSRPESASNLTISGAPGLDEGVLGDILASIDSTTGEEFFAGIVRHLASALKVRSAIASKAVKSSDRTNLIPSKLQVIGCWTDWQPAPDFECDTVNTPEAMVFDRGSYCCPDNLQATFPADNRLTGTGACSFLGTLLVNSYGEPLGTICIFHDRPLPQELLAKFQLILNIFAAHSAAELERQRLESALFTVEAKYCALVEQTPSVTYISPLNSGSIKLYISPQIETLLGYSVAEWKADPQLWFKLVHPEDRDRITVETAAEKFTLLGDIPWDLPLVSEYRAIARSGKIVWFRDRAIAVRDAATKSVVLQGAMFDITETKVAASALLESEYRYYTLAKILPVGIFRTDAAGDCVYLNEQFLEMAGLSLTEALGGGWTQNLHPEDRDRVLNQWYEAVSHKWPFKSEYRFCKDDRTTWVFSQAVPEIAGSGEVVGYLGTLTDISDRKQSEEAIKQAEAKYRSIFENAIEGIFQTTADGRYLSANPALARIYGYASPAETIAQITNIAEQLYVDPNRRTEFVGAIEENGSVSEFESQVYRADGTKIWISENGRAVRDAAGNLLFYEGTVEDITARKIAEEKLVHDALHDTLTGLPNRALFMDRLKHAIGLSKRLPDVFFAVLFIDLDRFKVVNDSLGHLVGDRLLIAIAQRLETCLRAGDTVARLGGDEFAILLENIKTAEDATHIAERVQSALAEPFFLNKYRVFTSASIGIVCSGLPLENSESEDWTIAPGDDPAGENSLLSVPSLPELPLRTLYDRPEELLRDADAAMYHAKAMGKARHEVFDLSMHTRAVALLQMENDLRRALERQEFQLYYQPIVSLTSGKICGFEALLRWQHPQRGLVTPIEFLSVAEETRSIVPISWWMMRSACSQMREWHQKFPANPPLNVSVNISNQQFKQPNLIEQIREILQETQLNPRSLKLEITESIIMENADLAATVLGDLSKLEIQLYIDDFGTGYSSLSRLHTFPTDALKIDRDFVSRMAEDAGNEAVVQTILILASHLGMNVIAEGIETSEQLNLLRTFQCEYGQGYFFSPPVNSQTASVLIANKPEW
ncbi:MAG: sensor domain-containing protein [Microcoleus sp.]